MIENIKVGLVGIIILLFFGVPTILFTLIDDIGLIERIIQVIYIIMLLSILILHDKIRELNKKLEEKERVK